MRFCQAGCDEQNLETESAFVPFRDGKYNRACRRSRDAEDMDAAIDWRRLPNRVTNDDDLR
jgi:hypothetical protein